MYSQRFPQETSDYNDTTHGVERLAQMKASIVIAWFKRDQRVQDHAPLVAASETGLPVLPLYVVEPEYWRQPFASRCHWHFIHRWIPELRQVPGTWMHEPWNMSPALQRASSCRTGEDYPAQLGLWDDQA